MRQAALTAVVVLAGFIVSSPVTCAAELVVHSQTDGPVKTNCYLLHDAATRQAAIFDVGGQIINLRLNIKLNRLQLKYIFITHAHFDHVSGLPELMRAYPDAKVCISKEEYEDSSLYRQWADKLDPKQVEVIRKNPDLMRLMDFDLKSIGEPAIFVKDGDVIRLGDAEIRAFLSPGHSRGSLCYAAGKVLFSGDVLLYRSVGRTDLTGPGGWEAIVKSIRRLYSSLPDDTVVFPGHGQTTDIGSEKNQNPKVSQHSAQNN